MGMKWAWARPYRWGQVDRAMIVIAWQACAVFVLF